MSRIADIIIEARLETKGFKKELDKLRTEIVSTFVGIRAIRDPTAQLRKQVRGTGEEVRDFGGTLKDAMREPQEDARRAAEGVEGVGDKTEDVGKKTKETGDTATKTLKQMEKDSERLSTQMRWVARDVMRIGFTAGVMGAIFIREIQSIARASMDLMIVFEDMQWLLEDIAWVIGEQIAPIFALLIPPLEMIRDFMEAHEKIALLVGIVIILGAVFFSLASIIMFVVGMYGILLFGMSMFAEEVEKSSALARETGSSFGVMSTFLKQMGGHLLGASQDAGQLSQELSETTQQIQYTTREVMALLKARTMVTGVAMGTKDMLEYVKSLKHSGQISKETYQEMSRGLLAHEGEIKGRLLYSLDLIKERFSGIKKIGGRVRGALGKIGGAAKNIGMTMAKATTAFASMIIIAAAMEPIMTALEPVISAISSVIEKVIEPLEPLIEMFAEFIENHMALVGALIAVAIAVWAISAAALPLTVIFGALLLIIFAIQKIFEYFGITLFGSGVHAAIVAVTTALKIMFWPLYLVYKLFTDATGVVNAFRRVLSKIVNVIRGFGAWIQNISPESIIEFAKAILEHLPNPIAILQSGLDILRGIWDIFTGDWKGGIEKIATAVKDIAAEFLKLPIAVLAVGIAVVKKLWEGIKSVVGWLKEKIVGGSLISDIIGMFTPGLGIALLGIGADLLKKLWEGIKSVFTWLKEKIVGGSLIWDIVSWFALLPLELLSIGAKMLIKLLKGIQSKISELLGDEGIGGIVASILNFFIGIPTKLLGYGADMIEYLRSGIMSMWETLFGGGGISDVVTAIINFFGGIPIKLLQYGIDMILHLRDGIISMWEKLFGTGGISDIVIGIINMFSGLITSAFEWGIGLIESFIKGIKSMATKLSDALSGLFDTEVIGIMRFKSTPKKGPLQDVALWGKGMMQEFMGGFNRGFNARDMFNRLGAMAPPVGVAPGGGTPNVTFQNEFVIYATVQDKQDLLTLRDEISMKQMEQARRMRVLSGGW